MTIEQIRSEAKAKVVMIAKATYNSKHKHCIGLHELYKESCDMMVAIENHAVKGKYPESLFEHRSPNQTAKESLYIKENYKQYTLNEFVDYLNTITRPFGDGNWSIDYREEESAFTKAGKSFQTYVESELPIYGSLETFVKSILPNIKSVDANGFLATRPKEIEYILNEAEQMVVDPLEPPKPTLYYFDSKSVMDYKENEYYLFLSKEKSTVEFGGKQEELGLVFELYTKNEIIFLVQYGKKNENLFKEELFFTHNENKCPVYQLKGIPNLSGDKILWQSPFLYGVDLLDCVAVNSNWLQFSINKCVFPMTVMYGSTCEFKDTTGAQCQDGYLHHEGKTVKCHSCLGAGIVGRLSPLGTLFINPSTKFEVGEEKATQAPLSYISPEVTPLEFIEKKIDKDTNKARQILHLRNKNSSVKTTNDVTATEVFDDAKGMIAFVKPIIDQIFDIYLWALQTIAWQRYRDSAPEPALTYPKSFDFKTPEDYLQDLTIAMEKNLPPALVQTLLFQYINSFYGDSERVTLIFKLAISADRLFGLTQDEINMKLARGTVAKWEDILHSSVLSFIADSILLDPKFLEKENSIKIETLVNLSKEKESEIKGTLIDITKTLLP